MKGKIAFILGIIITICMIWFTHDGYKMAAKAGIGIGIVIFVAVLVIILLVKNFLEKE